MKNEVLRVTYRYLLIGVCLVGSFSVNGQSVLINEVVSDNPGQLVDSDGNSPDWVELKNSGSQSINLNGWFLSDDPENPSKWRFPDFGLIPGERKVIYASGKDRIPAVAAWNPVIIRGDNCKYVIGSAAISQTWRNPAFSDASWLNGKTSVGFGDNDDATTVAKCISVFLRIKFTVTDTSELNEALFFADYDDGFVAWLNGKEITRANMPGAVGTLPAWNSPASSIREAVIYTGGKPDVFTNPAIKSALLPGENVLAIEIHNSDANSSDLTIIPYLVLGFSAPQSGLRPVPAVCTLPPVEYHTNFSLNAGGESVLLSAPDSSIVDQVTVPELFSGFSWARIPDGSSTWGLAGRTTPSEINPSSGFIGIGPGTTVSVAGGFFSSPFAVQVTSPNPDYVTRYTLDGSVPVITSPVFPTDLIIKKTAVLKTRTFRTGYFPGPVTTESYFIADVHNLPVVSISVDSNWFFQPDTGIYVMGPNASGGFPYFGANFWLDKEVPVQWEYFDKTGTRVTSYPAGLKIFGMYSRAQNQRSFSLFARSGYGASEFKYPFFDNNPVRTFQSLVLRNSGNDWAYSGIRDHLTSELIGPLEVDRLQSKPVVVYLNGKYWGIYFLMEKTSEHLIANRHQVNKDAIEMIELGSGWGEYHSVLGSVDSWNSFIEWMQNKDMTDPSVSALIKYRMDVQNFMTYQSINIFVANNDWPGNNYKFWRLTSPVTQWKWLVYDTDFGYGLFNSNAWQLNFIEFASTEFGDPFWPNPPISTYLFRKLLENEEFKGMFINTSMDLMNTVFKTGNTLSVLNRISTGISAEIPAHRLRWQSDMQGSWSDQVNSVRNFLTNRNQKMILHLYQLIKKGGTSLVTLSTDSAMGSIRLNSILVTKEKWAGTYFSEIPITISAIPNPGFKFVGWKGSSTELNPVLNVLPGSSFSVTAEFEPVTSENARVLFNEINYNSASGSNTGDWVEFVNPETIDSDISGWRFYDEDDSHLFTIPNGTILPAGGFLVLAEQPDTLLKRFPGIAVISIPLSFGFSGSGELLRLYKPSGELMDSVRYSDSLPWPVEADGTGKTLEKRQPLALSWVAENWKTGSTNGTPGSINSIVDALAENKKTNLPDEFKLTGNYPNPFNPSTTLQFNLPESGLVRLEVFDLTGKSIFSEERKFSVSGKQYWVWNASGFSSGLFFYRMTWKEQNQTGKMILIK
ncbi:MAG: CotH kinase family protein [Bacteroidetes bacterium]|nr:CotH kinase family protein [Bacteroidota bacterium]